jgi:hypothetical protein
MPAGALGRGGGVVCRIRVGRERHSGSRSPLYWICRKRRQVCASISSTPKRTASKYYCVRPAPSGKKNAGANPALIPRVHEHTCDSTVSVGRCATMLLVDTGTNAPSPPLGGRGDLDSTLLMAWNSRKHREFPSSLQPRSLIWGCCRR